MSKKSVRWHVLPLLRLPTGCSLPCLVPVRNVSKSLGGACLLFSLARYQPNPALGDSLGPILSTFRW